MSRKPAGCGGITSMASAINQENNTCRTKTIDGKNEMAPRPTRQPPLRDVKNHANQAMPKRTVSLKDMKCDETNAAKAKVVARRPLHGPADSSNASLAGGKHAELKQVRGVTKNITFQTDASSLSVLANSTLNATAAETLNNKSKQGTSFVSSKANVAAQNGKPRLLRNNATLALRSTKGNVTVKNVSKSETAELCTLQTTTTTALAPVVEENESAVSKTPVQDNAYSSSMMLNIDAGDEDNPQLVCAYVNNIYDYLRKLEQEQRIRENFLEGKEVNSRMRSILIDWLSQVHIRFHLLPETLYMTVSLIDRFLQEVSVPKEKLQLVGVTSMFVASKYEEMYAPEIGDFSYITDHSCSKHDIRMMECLLLRTLGFKLGRPLPIHFLRRYSKAADADATKHTLAKYFLELALVHYPLSHFEPSIMAAAALWLSLKLLDPSFTWSVTLVHYTKYRESDFLPCLRRLCRAVVKTHTCESKQQAIRDKFSTSKFMDISKHPCLDLASIRKYGEC